MLAEKEPAKAPERCEYFRQTPGSRSEGNDYRQIKRKRYR